MLLTCVEARVGHQHATSSSATAQFLMHGGDVQHMTASNSIVAAAGVSEAMAKGLSEEFLGGLPTGSKAVPGPSMYVGGGSSEHSSASCTAVIAFESPGWSDMKQAMMSTVVRLPLAQCRLHSMGGMNLYSVGGTVPPAPTTCALVCSPQAASSR